MPLDGALALGGELLGCWVMQLLAVMMDVSLVLMDWWLAYSSHKCWVIQFECWVNNLRSTTINSWSTPSTTMLTTGRCWLLTQSWSNLPWILVWILLLSTTWPLTKTFCWSTDKNLRSIRVLWLGFVLRREVLFRMQRLVGSVSLPSLACPSLTNFLASSPLTSLLPTCPDFQSAGSRHAAKEPHWGYRIGLPCTGPRMQNSSSKPQSRPETGWHGFGDAFPCPFLMRWNLLIPGAHHPAG